MIIGTSNRVTTLTGTEIRKTRPALVISPDDIARYLPTVEQIEAELAEDDEAGQ